jgi:beta-galactosidase
VIWGLSPLEVLVQRPLPDGKVEAVRLWGWHDEQPCWTWPEAQGKLVTVRVYSAGDRVELRLNGCRLDSKQVTAADRKCVEFTTTYEPGVLEVLAYRNGAQIARKRLVTAGVPASIRLTAERSNNDAARRDMSYIAVEVLDGAGHVVPNATTNVQLCLSGAAELIAFGSANPFAVGGFQSSTAQTWNGRALAILRGRGGPGRVKLEARGQGLESGSVELHLT